MRETLHLRRDLGDLPGEPGDEDVRRVRRRGVGPTLGTVITPVLQNVVSVTVVALSTRWVMVPLLVSNPLAPL